MASAKKRFKKFTSITDELSFELVGETFVAFPELDHRAYTRTIGSLSNASDEEDSVSRMLSNITEFLLPEFRDKFTELIEDESVIIPVQVIADIWRFLLVEYKVIPEDDDLKK